MNLSHLQLGAIAVCCSIASTVLGGIDTPPPWAGSGITGNSTHWHWDFGANSTAPAIGVGNGPPNSPPPIVTGGAWAPNVGANGSWGLAPGDSITIDLANYPNPNDFKLIWIQYHLVGLAGAPVQPPQMQVEFGGTLAGPYGTPVFAPTPDGGAIGAQGFRFPFNPPVEIIHIFNNTQVPMFFEWLTIDTICAPTPGAAAMMLLGSTALMRRRR
ncbi:MAG: hypothetical protein QM783_09750 [Phycisphaerales bacterium]